MTKESLDPDLINEGAAALRAGEVTFLESNGQTSAYITEEVTEPQEAAFYTLRARGLSIGEVVLNQGRLKRQLAIAIGRRVPKWRQLRNGRSEHFHKAA